MAAVLSLFAATAQAHQLDEYLQATRLAFARDRIVLRIDLTPGVDVARSVFARIDTSRDGRISEGEGRAYAKHVLNEMVLELDVRKLPLEFARVDLPTFEEMSLGVGIIRIEARATWTTTPGSHELFVRNNHRPDCGVYLVNALVPANPEIEITGQKRDPLQREIRVEFKS